MNSLILISPSKGEAFNQFFLVTIFFRRKTRFRGHSPTSFRSPKLEEAGTQIEGLPMLAENR